MFNLINGNTSLLGSVLGTGGTVVEPDAERVVNSLNDWPTPIGGVITLPAVGEPTRMGYFIGGDVNIGVNRIVITPGTTVKFDGISGVISRIIAAQTSGPLITFTGASVAADFVQFISGATQPIFFSGTSSGAQIFLHRCVAALGSYFLDLTDCDDVELSDLIIAAMQTGVYRLAGSIGTLSISRNQAIELANGTFLDLTSCAISETAVVSQTFMNPLYTGTFISGLANNGNLASDVQFLASQNTTPGASPVLSGVTRDDNQYVFTGNDIISDSRPEGDLSLTGNATSTTFAMIGDTSEVAGTWVIGGQSQSVGDATGNITFNNKKPVQGFAIVTGSIFKPSGGSSNDYDICFFKNGVPLVPGIITISLRADALPFALTVPTNISDTDVFDVRITAVDSTNSVTVTSAVFIVS